MCSGAGLLRYVGTRGERLGPARLWLVPPLGGELRLQLWTIYYAPEPTGIAPVTTLLARLLTDRGWDVEVVAAHPHYPEPRWGTRLRPYREVRDGIRIMRVPLWIGRETTAARIRQEVSFASMLLASTPILGPPLLRRPDAMLVVSPSFPALVPALLNARLRRLPLALWLHDLLPDGAAASGLIDDGGFVLQASRWLERIAYQQADRIIVLSAAFSDNLRDKGVPAEKIELIYDPATRGVPAEVQPVESNGASRVLCMGNIGLTQGLAPLVRDFEESERMRDLNVRLVITGNGVAADEVRARNPVRPGGDGWPCRQRPPRARVAIRQIGSGQSGLRRNRVQLALEAHELHGIRAPNHRGGQPGQRSS